MTKFARVMGLVLNIGFCAGSILLFKLQKEILVSPAISETARSILKYPSYIEDRFYDLRMMVTQNPKAHSSDIVLGAIDEKALKTFGRWPFTRTHWAKIVERLNHFGAKVVAYDVIFSEKERPYGGVKPDEMLASALTKAQASGTSNILSYSLTSADGSEDEFNFKEVPGEMLNFIMDSNQSGQLGMFPRNISTSTFPVPELLAANTGLGFIEGQADIDGVFRRYPVATNNNGLYFPSFSLLAYQLYSGDIPKLRVDALGNGELSFKHGKLPLNYFAETKVRWFGAREAFTEFSLADLVAAKDNDADWKNKINGKIIFVGSTAFGANDIRNTPVDAIMPGVYFHMNLTQMLLDGLIYQSEDNSLLFSWLILGVGSILMIGVALFHHAILDFVVFLILIGGTLLADIYILIPHGYQITLFFSLLAILGVYSWNTLLNFYLASKDKQFLKNAFGTYISPELIDEMYRSGKHPSLGGESGVRTAYFTDIQGFSTFSEKLTPTRLVELLNEYLSAMTDILLLYKGTLDKYEGDAIIAFFGAPLPMPDHAACACKVALAMQDALIELRKKWTSEGEKWPAIVHDMRMRIGINTGEMVTGNMGSKLRMNYTMMGDTVNLSARLEASAKQYGIFTHLSQFTFAACKDLFDFRELDTIRVVGKSEPVTTYDLLGEKGKTSEVCLKLAEHFHLGLAQYKTQKWDEAIACFQKSLECEHQRFPELAGKKTNPSKIYIERCEEFKKNPPGADWDGVYTLTEK